MKAVARGKFAANLFLDVQSNDDQSAVKLIFNPIHDGLHGSAGNSVGRLELKQHRRTLTDLGLDPGGVIHQRRLEGPQDQPAGNKSCQQQADNQVILPLWSIAEQQEGYQGDQDGHDPEYGILVDDEHVVSGKLALTIRLLSRRIERSESSNIKRKVLL